MLCTRKKGKAIKWGYFWKSGKQPEEKTVRKKAFKTVSGKPKK